MSKTLGQILDDLNIEYSTAMTVDWQHYRIQAAIAAMQGMIANPQTFEQLVHDKGYEKICGGDKSQIIAIASVMYADALIAELKGGQDETDKRTS